ATAFGDVARSAGFHTIGVSRFSVHDIKLAVGESGNRFAASGKSLTEPEFFAGGGVVTLHPEFPVDDEFFFPVIFDKRRSAPAALGLGFPGRLPDDLSGGEIDRNE